MLKKRVMSKKRMLSILPIAAVAVEAYAASVSDASCSQIVEVGLSGPDERKLVFRPAKFMLVGAGRGNDWQSMSWWFWMWV